MIFYKTIMSIRKSVSKCTSRGILKCFLNITRTFLRTTGFLIFFAGDSDRTKADLHNALNKKPVHRFFIYLFIVIFISLFITITIGPYINQNILKKPTTFNISAVTEEVMVVTEKIPMSAWPVKNIDLSRDCPDEKKDTEKFSGSIHINPSVQITFTRRAFGDIKVTMFNNEGKNVGELYDVEDEHFGSLTDCAFFYISNIVGYKKSGEPVERKESGETIVFPISGKITAGNEMHFLTQHAFPILREGQITILDRSFIIGENYSAGSFNLGTGDSFEIINPTVPSQGIVLINEEAAINLVFMAKGERGIIKRYKSEDYELKNSYWSKLYNDEALSLAWIFIIILFSIIRVYLRFLVN